MASRAPAVRVALGTKRKARVRPSGEKASSCGLPLRWVSWRILPVADGVEEDLLLSRGWPRPLPQVERKAREPAVRGEDGVRAGTGGRRGVRWCGGWQRRGGCSDLQAATIAGAGDPGEGVGVGRDGGGGEVLGRDRGLCVAAQSASETVAKTETERVAREEEEPGEMRHRSRLACRVGLAAKETYVGSCLIGRYGLANLMPLQLT